FNSGVFGRVSGLVRLMALGAAALIAFPQYGLPWPLTASLVAGGLVLVLGWWMCPRLVRLLPVGNRLRRQVETELGPFWRDRVLLARVAVASLAFHLTQVGAQYVLARAAGVALPFSYCLVLHPVISVMTALPLSVAGIALREGGYPYFLGRSHHVAHLQPLAGGVDLAHARAEVHHLEATAVEDVGVAAAAHARGGDGAAGAGGGGDDQPHDGGVLGDGHGLVGRLDLDLDA